MSFAPTWKESTGTQILKGFPHWGFILLSWKGCLRVDKQATKLIVSLVEMSVCFSKVYAVLMGMSHEMLSVKSYLSSCLVGPGEHQDLQKVQKTWKAQGSQWSISICSKSKALFNNSQKPHFNWNWKGPLIQDFLAACCPTHLHPTASQTWSNQKDTQCLDPSGLM